MAVFRRHGDPARLAAMLTLLGCSNPVASRPTYELPDMVLKPIVGATIVGDDVTVADTAASGIRFERAIGSAVYDSFPAIPGRNYRLSATVTGVPSGKLINCLLGWFTPSDSLLGANETITVITRDTTIVITAQAPPLTAVVEPYVQTFMPQGRFVFHLQRVVLEER